MKVPAKIQCDICGKEIDYRPTNFKYLQERLHYNVKLISYTKDVIENLEGKPQRTKIKLDMCGSCFNKMIKWIRTEGEKS